jgi:hypothetical protein
LKANGRSRRATRSTRECVPHVPLCEGHRNFSVKILVSIRGDAFWSSRQFWMYCREDLRKLKRITLLWDYIRNVTEQNQGLLMGETRQMHFAD